MKKQTSILTGSFVWIILLFLCVACTEENNSTDINNTKTEVWNTVKEINRHWAITIDMDSLSRFIYPDMVIFYPGGKVEGKEEILEAYRLNAVYNKTVSLEELYPVIRLYNDNKTAVVTYYCILTALNPENEVRTYYSQDMYTLIWQNGQWFAVAQHYSFVDKII